MVRTLERAGLCQSEQEAEISVLPVTNSFEVEGRKSYPG